jgi:oligoribonuclease (3'-5' exoribonuclease)
MKYASLDIETTGDNPSIDQVLQISIVVEDTANQLPIEQLPSFTCIVKHDRYCGNAFALQLNSWILKEISKAASAEKKQEQYTPKYPIYNFPQALEKMAEFLKLHFKDEKPTVAGKNVAGFDLQFFPNDVRKLFLNRVIDPAILFVDWDKDSQLPDLKTCKHRAKLEEYVSHDALDDARDIIKVVREKINAQRA